MIAEVQRNFPGHGIVAEESGGLAGDGACDCAWYIDPLDGTVNFAHGVPYYSVSVAYAEDGQVLLGVVYHPNLDECFSAERGRGAWLNGKPIHVSNPIDLDHSLLATGFPYDVRTTTSNNLENYGRFARLSQGVRRLGSASLDCCYIACGRFDGYWEMSVKSYDIAAGALIAEEAGAMVSTVRGSPDYLVYKTSILAAPPHIHARMLELLNNQSPE
jgi:myo-inositol-1(or 4)-monophosphatase